MEQTIVVCGLSVAAKGRRRKTIVCPTTMAATLRIRISEVVGRVGQTIVVCGPFGRACGPRNFMKNSASAAARPAESRLRAELPHKAELTRYPNLPTSHQPPPTSHGRGFSTLSVAAKGRRRTTIVCPTTVPTSRTHPPRAATRSTRPPPTRWPHTARSPSAQCDRPDGSRTARGQD